MNKLLVIVLETNEDAKVTVLVWDKAKIMT